MRCTPATADCTVWISMPMLSSGVNTCEMYEITATAVPTDMPNRLRTAPLPEADSTSTRAVTAALTMRMTGE